MTVTDAQTGHLASQRLGRIASASPWHVRFLEIRGTAEAILAPDGSAGLNDKALIRIHPTRILSFGIEEPPQEPHLTRLSTRDLA